MIDTEPEYSYDPVADVHSFNPLNMFIERPTRGRSRERSTIIIQNEKGITTIPVYNSVKGVDNILELHSVETQTEGLSMHGLTELVENVVDGGVIALSAASGIPVVTESGEAPPPADDGRRAETQEEYELVEDDDQIIVSDEHIIVQEEIVVQSEIMDPDVEAFVEELMQETDAFFCFLCRHWQGLLRRQLHLVRRHRQALGIQ